MALAKPRAAAAVGVAVAFAAAALLLPRWVNSPYALHLFILVLLGIALGESWNLIGGFAGQYSIGHAAYYGVGAYATAVLLQRAQLAPWYGAWLAMGLAMAVALVIGTLCFRLRGPYFVLASIAVAEIIRLVALEWKGATNGAEGILLTELPPLKLGQTVLTDFSSKVPFYYLALALAALSVLAGLAVRSSKVGYCLQAIREDQDAAHSLGISLSFYKNLALILSAALTSLAGAFYALYVGFIDPSAVLGIDVSVQAVLICIIGGVGTVLGPLLGAAVLVLLSEGLRANLLAQGLFALGVVSESSAYGTFLKENLAHAHALIYGLLMVLVILFMPEGVAALTGGRRSRGTSDAAS